jgi:HK97 family phage major capsid protein
LSASSGPDGGYDLPPEFFGEIASIAYTEESLLKLANTMPVSGNSMSFPGDETTPWGSSGIIAA